MLHLSRIPLGYVRDL